MNLKISTLGEICHIKSGNSIPSREKESLYRNILEGIPYIATKDIDYDGSINFNNGVRIPPKFKNKFRLSEKNSVLICAEGGSAGKKIAYSNKDCHFVNKLFSIKGKEGLDTKYIYYYTLSNEFQKQFRKSLNGLIGGVSISKIKNFEITYPSINEQKSIVAKLDNTFAQIDVSIANLLKKKKEVSKLFDLISKDKLNNSNNQLKIDDVCLKITDGSHFSPKSFSSGYPDITVRDIQSDKINFKNCKFINENDFNLLKKNGCSPEFNDLLFSKDGTVGKVALIKEKKDFVVLSSLAIIRPNKSIVIPEFLFFLLKSKDFINAAIKKKTGAAIRRIVLKNLKNIKVKIPDLNKQREIVNFLNELEKGISNLLNIIEKNYYNYKALKKSLLKSFLSPNTEITR